eukprot:7435372-Ditylum_brightwellii.AAC.1
MEIDMFHEDNGKRTAWDKYSDNSNNEGDWIKVSGGRTLMPHRARTSPGPTNGVNGEEFPCVDGAAGNLKHST